MGLTQHLRAKIIMLNVSVNTPLQLGLADLIYSRAYREHINTLRPVLLRQVEQYRQYIISAFDTVAIALTQPHGGCALWLQLPEEIDSLEMYRYAQQQGVNIVPGEVFGEDQRYKNYIQLNAGHKLSLEICQAIDLLADWARKKSIY